MQTSIDVRIHEAPTDLDDGVGSGLATWIVAAISMELVIAIVAAIAWVTARV